MRLWSQVIVWDGCSREQVVKNLMIVILCFELLCLKSTEVMVILRPCTLAHRFQFQTSQVIRGLTSSSVSARKSFVAFLHLLTRIPLIFFKLPQQHLKEYQNSSTAVSLPPPNIFAQLQQFSSRRLYSGVKVNILHSEPTSHLKPPRFLSLALPQFPPHHRTSNTYHPNPSSHSRILESSL